MRNKLFYLFVLSGSYISAQPAIEWQKSIGSTHFEVVYSIISDNQNDYVLCGKSDSSGTDDYVIIKLDNTGSTIWQRLIGGSSGDESYSVIQDFDSGYLVIGKSLSNDGDVSGHIQGAFGFYDYWIVKLDSSGNIQWQKCLGGTSNDEAKDIIQLTDSNYFIVGSSMSLDYDVHGNHGGTDIWAVLLRKNGTIKWTKALGGSSYDEGVSCKVSADHGLFIAGRTASNNGDVSGNHNSLTVDAWVIKLDSAGQMLWQRCYGGTNIDNSNEILLSDHNGFYLSATTFSIDGDVTGCHGRSDYWLLKCDSIGNILWQKCYGGPGYEQGESAITTPDGGLIITGSSEDTTTTGNHGGEDFWTIKVDSTGNFEWGKFLGGSGNDHAYSIAGSHDGGLIVAGNTFSIDGDITINHGDEDMWVVKLSSLGLSVNENTSELMDVSIAQLNNQIRVKYFSKHSLQARINIYSIDGRIILSDKIYINEGVNYNSFYCSKLVPGIYCLQIEGKQFSQSLKFVSCNFR